MPVAPAENLATNYTAQPSRNQIKKPITSTCTSTTTCTYFVDVDVHVLVDGCCHLQICFQKVKDFRPSNTNLFATADGCDEVHLAGGLHAFQQPERAYQPDRGHRDVGPQAVTLEKALFDAGMGELQIVYDLPHCRAGDLHLPLASGQIQAWRECRRWPSGQAFLLQRASMTAAGFIGKRFIRTPAARWIAFAIAAGGGTLLASPTPRAPNGCPGFGTSTITVSIIGRSRLVGMR